jgi:hypothetical protein
MCAIADLDAHWELVLHATGSALRDIDPRLFFDDEVVWHQQQLGLPGQIATANLVVDGSRLYTFVHISDLVQRISRRRSQKTLIEKRFKGWHQMLMNGICNFAVEVNCREVLIPTPHLAMQHTARFRRVQPELFQRVYRDNVLARYRAEQRGSWWVVDLSGNRDRVLIARKAEQAASTSKTISVCHDVEAGYGHRDEDPALAERADRHFPRTVETILDVEHRAGIRATYNVVGKIAGAVRDRIVDAGHCLAFHSYDHRIDRISRIETAVSKVSRSILGWPASPPHDSALYQLRRCRTVDYRLKGYRAPQSRLTRELTAENLCHYNFEWLASSAQSLELTRPAVQNRLARIPIHFDDWPMYRGRLRYNAWEQKALSRIASCDAVAFSLHDCYSDWWLPSYPAFLERVCALGQLRTLDEVAAETYLRAAM